MKTLLNMGALVALGIASTVVAAEDIAITGGTAFTHGGSGKVENATILMSDGKIVSVTEDGAIPDGYRMVDASGKWVTAGFMVSDTYLGLVEIPLSGDNNDATAKTVDDTINLSVTYSYNPENSVVGNTRIEGVTRALTRFSSTKDNWRGTGAVVQLGSGDPFVKTPAVLGIDLDSGAAEDTGGSKSALWASLEAKLDGVKAGSVKKEEDKKPSPSDMLLADVLEGKLPLMITVHRASDIRNVIAFKEKYGVKVILAGAREAWVEAEALAKADIPVVIDPVLNLAHTFDQLAATGANAARLAAAGVKVAFTGPDTHNSRLVPQHAGNAVAMGMSWEAAVDALTVNPAEIFGISGSYGTLEAGMDADVVVWDGDPLEVMTSPDFVFIQGEDIPLVSRQTKLRDRYIDLPRAPGLKH